MMPDEIDGPQFRKARRVLGWTRKQAARYIGVEVETVKSWELNRRRVPRYAIVALYRLGQKRGGINQMFWIP